jgi:predicted nuclease with TOPRIM domain
VGEEDLVAFDVADDPESIGKLRHKLAESEAARKELWDWCQRRISELEAANQRLAREKVELWEWCEPQMRKPGERPRRTVRSLADAVLRRTRGHARLTLPFDSSSRAPDRGQ